MAKSSLSSDLGDRGACSYCENFSKQILCPIVYVQPRVTQRSLKM